MNDDDDIYSDLATINCHENTPKKVDEENSTLKKQLEEKEKELVEIRERNDALEREKKTLEENISSLYKTAVNELKKKEAVIDELTRQKDSILFRREKRQIVDRGTLPDKGTLNYIKHDQHGSPLSKKETVVVLCDISEESVPVISGEGKKFVGLLPTDESSNRKHLSKTNEIFEKSISSSSSNNQHDSRDKFSKNSVPEESSGGKYRFSDSSSEKYPYNVPYQKKSNSNTRFRSPNRTYRSSRLYDESLKEDEKSSEYSRYYSSNREMRRRERYDVGKSRRERHYKYSDRSPSPKRVRRDNNISEDRYSISKSKHKVQSDSIRLAAQVKSKYSKAARERSVSRTPTKKNSEANFSNTLLYGAKKSKKVPDICYKPKLDVNLIQDDVKTKRKINSPPHKPPNDLIDVNDILKSVQSKLKENFSNSKYMKKTELISDESVHPHRSKSSLNSQTGRENCLPLETLDSSLLNGDDLNNQLPNESRDVISQSVDKPYKSNEKIIQNIEALHKSSVAESHNGGAESESHSPSTTPPFKLQKEKPVSESKEFIGSINNGEKCMSTEDNINVSFDVQTSKCGTENGNHSFGELKNMPNSQLKHVIIRDKPMQDGSIVNTACLRTPENESEKESYTPPSTPPGKIQKALCVSSDNSWEKLSKPGEKSLQNKNSTHIVSSNSQPPNISEKKNCKTEHVVPKNKISQFSKDQVVDTITENNVKDGDVRNLHMTHGSKSETLLEKNVISVDLSHKNQLREDSSNSINSTGVSKNNYSEKVNEKFGSQSSILFSLLTNGRQCTTPGKVTPLIKNTVIVSTPSNKPISPKVSPSSVVKEHKFSYSVSNEQCEFQRPKRKRSVRLSGGNVNQSSSPSSEKDNSKEIEKAINDGNSCNKLGDAPTCIEGDKNIFAEKHSVISSRVTLKPLQYISGSVRQPNMVVNSSFEKNAKIDLTLNENVKEQSCSVHKSLALKKTVKTSRNHGLKKKRTSKSRKDNIISSINVSQSNIMNKVDSDSVLTTKKIHVEKDKKKNKLRSVNKDNNKAYVCKKILGSINGNDILENMSNNDSLKLPPTKVTLSLEVDVSKNKNNLSKNVICDNGDKNGCLKKSISANEVAEVKFVPNAKPSVNCVFEGQKLQVKNSPSKKKNLDTICDELKANLEKKNVNVDVGTTKPVLDKIYDKIDSDLSKLNTFVTENVLFNKSSCEKNINKTVFHGNNPKPIESGKVLPELKTNQRIIVSKFRRRVGNLQDSPTHVFSKIGSLTN